ncbi:MAG: site-specific integrase [Novosphingobium sp.]
MRSERGGRRVSENPFAGLHKDTSKLKRANARPPFTAEQITAIIQSPLFTGFLADGKESISGEKQADDWRKWIPLICLFTGARIGEVAQLRVDDVYKDDGIWCIEFRHDERTGQKTKSDRSRFVALHAMLLDIGFLEFVEREKERSDRDGNLQLFPDMKLGARQQFGDYASAWWRDYLVAIGVKPKVGGDGFGSHSFRHTMADQLRAAGHLDDVIGAVILGHSTTSVTGGYGQSRQGTAKLSKDMIDSVKFVPIERGKVVEGGKPVDFSHLKLAGTDLTLSDA